VEAEAGRIVGMQVEVIGGEVVRHHVLVVVGPRVVGLHVTLRDEEHVAATFPGGVEVAVQ